MTLEFFLSVLTRIVFVVLAIVTLAQWGRSRDRIRFDVAMIFISLALLIVIQGFEQTIGLEVPWLNMLGSLAVISHPYFLLRVAHYFHPVNTLNTLVSRGALVGLVISWLALIFTPSPLPIWLTLLLIAYFAVVEIYAALSLVRGTFTASGITKHRLQLASAGSGLLAAVFLVAGLQVVLPAETRPLFNPVAQFLALLACMSYYIGFAPPRWLRKTWQLNELHQFIQDSGNRLTRGRTVIFDELSRAALQTVGGTAALIARRDGAEGSLLIESASEPTLQSKGLPIESAILAQVWQEQKARVAYAPDQIGPGLNHWAEQYHAKALFIVPILSPFHLWGMLIVALRYRPIFIQDDLDLLTLLSQQSAIPLDYTELIEQLQASNLALEQRFTKAFHASPAALAITRLSDGKIIDVNESFLRLFGFQREEVVGHRSEELNIYANPAERADVLGLLRKQGFIHNYELASRQKSGHEIRIIGILWV